MVRASHLAAVLCLMWPLHAVAADLPDGVEISLNSTIKYFEGSGAGVCSFADCKSPGIKTYIDGLLIEVSVWNKTSATCDFAVDLKFHSKNRVEKLPFSVAGASEAVFEGSTHYGSITVRLSPQSSQQENVFISTRTKSKASGLMFGVLEGGSEPVLASLRHRVRNVNCR